MRHIFEMPVYCGRTKVWRVVNLNSGTIYSPEFDTYKEAAKSIDDGTIRCNLPVVRIVNYKVSAILDEHWVKI